MINLRKYQRESIDSLYSYWGNMGGHPIIVLPTGTGKSIVLAQFIKEALQWKGTRIVVLTHVKELIEQDLAETLALWPECPAGVYSAGLKRRDINAQVLFAGIQSIYKRAYELQWVDLVIIDEAHLIPNNSDTMYRKFLNNLKEINPKVKYIGLTATPFRMNSGLLHEGKNALFDDICYESPLKEMIDEGFLSPLKSKSMATKLDISGVGKSGGEYITSQLQEAVDIEEVTSSAINEVVEFGKDRKAWLAFCSGVNHVFNVRDEIRSRGYSCEGIVADTPADERAQIIKDFKNRKIKCLAAMNVLTTGFNAPHVDLIAMLRPTASVGLYVQMVGRGTRNSEGKENCLILDFAGNVERHGPVDTVDGKKKPKTQLGGLAPTKNCPECHEILLIAQRVCRECGYVFPPPKIKINAEATTNAVLSDDVKADWFPVTDVSYTKHEKSQNKFGQKTPPSMRATYYNGLLRVASEWICFEHEGWAKEFASRWWNKRMPGRPVPSSVSEALLQRKAIPPPFAIALKKDGKYFKIVKHDFENRELLNAKEIKRAQSIAG